MLSQTAVPRVRLGSLEPWELTDAFWSLFDDPRLMPHLHLPLQSGADSVLRRMSRRCRSADFRELVRQARQAIPGFGITTDIIVGFPGETDAEWRQTVAFARAMPFSHIHVFAYSPRAGTRAAGMPDQLSHNVKRMRSRQMHALAQAGRRQILSRAVGQIFEVLIEGRSGGDAGWSGYTPNYLRVEIEGDTLADLDNRIIRVRATALSADGERLLARPL